MATMNISLPDKMKQWVEQQVATGRFANASDYVRDLVRRDEERAQKIAAFQREIDKGIASGISDRSIDEIFADARANAIKALEERDGVSGNQGGGQRHRRAV
jgi:antitoxin ParD1/3/4